MTVFVLQHVAPEGPGRIADALSRAGHALTTVHLYAGDPVPTSLDDVSGLVVMGGPMSVGDTAAYPHLAHERRLIASCLRADLPVLGVCLGAQLLAAEAGGSVRAAAGVELGWQPVTLTPDASDDPVFDDVPSPFHPLHWHGDEFDLPPNAVALASSDMTRVQAFRTGGHAYGLLFHLEVDAGQVAAMVQAFPDDLVRAAAQPADVLDPQRPLAVQPVADRVFERWASLLAPPPS